MENSEYSEVPLIGRDVPWETIEGNFCLVKHFTPIAIVESGKIRDVSKVLPYASLLVECPKVFQGEAYIPVLHKQDFRNLWEVFFEVFDEREVSRDMEVLVVYAPLKRRKLTKLLSGILPSLVIQLHPKGFLERLHQEPEKGKVGEWFESLRPIAEWDARPEELK